MSSPFTAELTALFTIFTSPDPLSKRYELAADGSIVKTPAAQMTSGTAWRVSWDFRRFGDCLQDAGPNRAYCYGLHDIDKYGNPVKIAIKEKAKPEKGVLARIRDYFDYRAEPGIVMIDHDPSEYGATLTPAELRAVLAGIYPPFADACCWVRGSVSAGVHKIGEPPKTGRGFHLYYAVPDASDIPRFGKALFDRLWLNGYGFIDLSAAGSYLVRSAIDASVFCGERLDFVGAPILGAGLELTAPVPEFFEGGYLDTAGLAGLNEAEVPIVESSIARAKTEIEPRRLKKRGEWAAGRVTEAVARGVPERQAKAIFASIARDSGVFDLYGPFLLEFAQLGMATVGDVLATPTRYEGQALADPLEGPEYGRSTAKFFGNNGKPVVNSMAHGGQKFFLHKEAEPPPPREHGPLPWERDCEPLPLEWVGEHTREVIHINGPDCEVYRHGSTFTIGIPPEGPEMPAPPTDGGNPPPPDGGGGGGIEEDDDGRPSILIGDGLLVTSMQKAEECLFGGKGRIPPYYERGGLLMKIQPIDRQRDRGVPEDNIKREDGTIILQPVTPGWLQARMMEDLRFRRFDFKTKKMRTVNLPKSYVETYIERADWWVPVLRGISQVPVINADGTIHHKPGYDRKSGIFLDSHQKFPLPPVRKRGEVIDPKDDPHIRAAWTLFSDVFETFKPETPADMAVMVSGVLTGLCKTIIGASPGIAITAPVPGSGKGKIAHIISIIITGNQAPMMTWTHREDELKKQLDSALLAGDRIICLDEVRGRLKSGELDSMLTERVKPVRILSVSKNILVDASAVMYFAIGNNISIPADSSRRWLRCYIDPKCENPHLVKHDRDPLQHAMDNRVALVSAGLTLLHGFMFAGSPNTGVSLGSFEKWSDIVRGTLIWAGFGDPCQTQENWVEVDAGKVAWGGVLAIWHDAVTPERLENSDRMTAQQIIFLAESERCNDGMKAMNSRRYENLCDKRQAGGLAEHEQTEIAIMARGLLYDALCEVCADDKGKLSAVRLGQRLAKEKNAIVGGYRVAQHVERSKKMSWEVDRLG